MSTQQVLGVVGGVVGAFFGYPQLGFVVGSLVGGLLTPAEKTEGPRVDDLKVQVSTYGAGIPILYGTERVGGNVVWSTDKIETETTTGGKGGEPENTSYRYFVHMGIVLCDTPRDGADVVLVQIFQDGKLIWDAHSGIPVGSALASAENPHAFFNLYQGHADQLPDAIEELYMGGPGSVPAYRGVVRIRMNAIECPGGRIPQFSFVISNRFTTVKTVDEIGAVDGFEIETGIPNAEGAWHLKFTRSFQAQVFDCYNVVGGTATLVGTITKPPATYLSLPAAVVGSAPAQAVILGGFGGHTLSIDVIDIEAGSLSTYASAEIDGDPISIGMHGAAFDAISGRYVLLPGSGAGIFAGTPIYFTPDGALVFSSSSFSGDCGPVAFYDGTVYAVVVKLVGAEMYFYVETMNSDTGEIVTSVAAPLPGVNPLSYLVRNSMISAGANGVFVYLDVPSLNPHLYELIGATSFRLISPEASIPGRSGYNNPAAFYMAKDSGVFGPMLGADPARAFYSFAKFNAVDIQDVSVKTIIADQCDRAGEDRIDLSGIPDADVVHGYKLQNPASARSNIDPLLTAFSAYMVDEDGLIKFKKYKDITSVATISYDELGQAEAGAETADAMPLNRAQEVDLPRSVAVSYIEPLRDYQTASEKEVRQITDANEDMIVELPLATTSDRAKRVAQTILFDRWRAQNTRSCKVSRKYAFLSPGDGITVEYPRGTWRLWRITSMTDTGALIELNVEPGDAELYTQTAVGTTGYLPQEVAPLASPTRLQLLDIPILRDQDNNAGIYAALDNYGLDWSGAELLVGYDDASLVSRGTVSTDAPIGFTETVPGAAPSTFIDESNVFTVSIGNNDFSSVTRDVLLVNGGEFWALGAPGRWEIGASAVGDSLGGGRYILSRHLRGLFGTEANAALHQTGDAFVLLRIAGMLRPSMGVGDVGQAQQYRAISKGRSLNSAASQTYANTGEGLMPLSPVNLRRSNAHDLSVDRRSRLTMNNSTGALPLGEAVEAWSWEFYAAGDFVTRIGTALTTTATITSAQITAAGATPSGTLYVRVAQVSDSVGRGHELQATI